MDWAEVEQITMPIVSVLPLTDACSSLSLTSLNVTGSLQMHATHKVIASVGSPVERCVMIRCFRLVSRLHSVPWGLTSVHEKGLTADACVMHRLCRRLVLAAPDDEALSLFLYTV